MNRAPAPPVLAQRLLQAMLPLAMTDTFLGDLEEHFHQLAAQQGATSANLWYWQETLLALPRLTLYLLETGEFRRLFVHGPTSTRQPIWGTALSLLLLLPALLIVIPGLFFNLTGIDLPTQFASLIGPFFKSWIDNPWIIQGGLLVALAINSMAVAKYRYENAGEDIRFTFEIRKRTTNIVLLGLVIFLGLSIFAYLIAENLLPVT
ncbi:MAG TPA: permease prefix domain 2-containing transporter [Anaerolineales bacterium]|nr:permease prefix domain 2-containing transporter [Anaerolineales bacterium]